MCSTFLDLVPKNVHKVQEDLVAGNLSMEE